MEVTAMMTFPTSHTITYHQEMMAMINPRYRYSLQAKKQWEQNQTPQMSILMGCQAKLRQVLSSLILLMKYQRLKTLKPLVEKQAWKRMLVTEVALSGQDKDPNDKHLTVLGTQLTYERLMQDHLPR